MAGLASRSTLLGIFLLVGVLALAVSLLMMHKTRTPFADTPDLPPPLHESMDEESSDGDEYKGSMYGMHDVYSMNTPWSLSQ